MDSTTPTGIRRTPLLARMGLRAGLRVGLLCAGAALVAGCGSTSVTGAGGGAPGPVTPEPLVTATVTPTPTPTMVCSPEGVSLAAEEANAAMGLRVMGIRLTNCGTRPYTLNGHPGVRVLDAERAPLDIEVRRGSAGIATLDTFDAAPKPVTLQPGESASFSLAWRNTVTSGTRPADNGRFLDVAPLPGRPRLTVPAELDLGTTGRLGLSAWTKSDPDRPATAPPRPAAPQTG
ncbi:DUF4232 domain-containing protein [Streptomyces sp. CB01881]|uniref:DUF4232 domain-containing protein n=1 Tax=Streptomyces sp. CB01881 TaxID=2078691 RepID=UPI001386D20F|nr:DUF4232 domain-containing protein [Streptomyces sp. CB01881]